MALKPSSPFRSLPLDVSTSIASYLPRALISQPVELTLLLDSYPVKYIRVLVRISEAWLDHTSEGKQLPDWIVQSMAQMLGIDVKFYHPTSDLHVEFMELFSDIEQVNAIAVDKHNLCLDNLLPLASAPRMNKLRQLRLLFLFAGRQNEIVQFGIAAAISSIVANFPGLQYLELCSSVHLAEGLLDNSGLALALMASNLCYLLLGHAGLDASAAVELSKVMSHQSTIMALDCSNNRLADEGVTALASCLETNTSLKLLGLNNVGITELSGCALAKTLCKNSRLKVLLLGENTLGSDCGLAFARMLESNDTLEILVLTKTKLGTDGCRSFIKALEINRVLTHLHIANNGMATDDKHEIVRVAKEGESLKVLHIADKNELSGEIYDRAPRPINDFLIKKGLFVY